MASLPKQTPKDTERVGIREFRQNIAKYVLESDAPVVLTRHGDEVGYFIPLRKPKLTDEELKAFETKTRNGFRRCWPRRGSMATRSLQNSSVERKAHRKR